MGIYIGNKHNGDKSHTLFGETQKPPKGVISEKF